VSGTLTFADGETFKTFDIPLNYSNLSPAGLVGLKLSNPTGGATLGAQDTSYLYIIDQTRSALRHD